MVIITNEKKHAERMLEQGFLLTHKITYELSILYRYYIFLGVRQDEVERKLHDFCKFWLRKEYNYIKFIKIIEKVGRYCKNKVLKQGNEIVFTESEMRVILTIDNKVTQKVLYMMMFFGKIDGFGYCNLKETEIFKYAHATTKPDKRIEVLRSLYQLGFTKPTVTGGDKVLCINELTCKDTPLLFEELKEAGEKVAFVVDRYEDPIVYFLAYTGEKMVKECEGCGGLVMVKSNSAKWCEKCRKEKRLEGWRRSKEGAGRGDGNMEGD